MTGSYPESLHSNHHPTADGGSQPIYKGIILTWSTPAAPFNGERSPEVDCGRDLYIDVALSQHQQICVDVGISWWTQRKQIDVPAVGSRWIEQWV